MYPSEALWRRRKLSRTAWRKKIGAGKRRIPHGGRGKIYGLKSKKRRRRSVNL